MADRGRSSAAAGEEVLARFFGPHNDARRDSVPAALELFLNTGIGVFPKTTGTSTTWYAFALDERSAHELRALVQAFIGPSWSDWTGLAAELDARNPIEAALRVAAHGPVVRLQPLSHQEAPAVARACDLLVKVLAERPAEMAVGARPQHRLLADLELAFLAGNGDEASALIDDLAATGALSAINILFLKLRRLDAIGHHHEILTHPDLPDLLRRRRPRAITALIARAVRVELVDREQAAWAAGDPEAPRRTVQRLGDLDARYATVLEDPGLAGQADLQPLLALTHLARDEPGEAARAAAGCEDEANGSSPRSRLP